MSEDPDDRRDRTILTIGAAVAIGAGIGTVFFAVADNPLWIAVGAGVGAAVGAMLQGGRR